MLKKPWASLMIATLVLSPSFPAHASPDNNNISVTIDGVQKSIDPQPTIVQGTTYVPLSSLSQLLNVKVDWNEKTKTVTLVKGGKVITVQIGAKNATVNNQTVEMDQPAIIVKDRTMVPLRFFGQALGYNVTWDQDNRLVKIESPLINDVLGKTDSAQGTATTQTLTYEQALNLALESNVQVRNANANIDRAEEVRNNLSDKVKIIPQGNGSGIIDAMVRQAFAGLQEADISWQSSKKQLQVVEDSLAFAVKKAYDQIISDQSILDLAQLALQNKMEQRNVMSVKYQEGIASEYDLNKANLDVDDAKAKVEAAKKKLNDDYAVFNILVGLPQGERPILTDQPSFQELDDDLDTHVNQILSDSIPVWLMEQKVNIAKLELDLYTFNDPSNPTPYTAKQIDVEKAQNDVADTKQQLEQTTRSLYYNIKQLESLYAQYQANLKSAETTYNYAKANFEAGTATRMDLLNAQLAVDQLKQQITDTLTKLDYLRMAYEKPWAAAGSTSSTAQASN